MICQIFGKIHLIQTFFCGHTKGKNQSQHNWYCPTTQKKLIYKKGEKKNVNTNKETHTCHRIH